MDAQETQAQPESQAAPSKGEGPAASRRPPESTPMGHHRVRPMEDETALVEEAGPFKRLRERLTRSSLLGFQEQRKKKSPIDQKPDFSLLEIFYRYTEENGQPRKLTVKERFLRGFQMGNHISSTIGTGAKNAWGYVFARDAYDPTEINPLPGERGRLEINPGQDQKKNEEEAAKPENQEQMDRDERSSRDRDQAKAGSGARTGAAASDVRVFVDPEDTSNRVASNHVGPERQVRHDTGAWPIDKPRPERAAPRALDAPDRPAQVEGPATPRRVAGPERPAMITDQRKRAEDASDRGRAAAHDLAARKAAEKAARAATRKALGAER